MSRIEQQIKEFNEEAIRQNVCRRLNEKLGTSFDPEDDYLWSEPAISVIIEGDPRSDFFLEQEKFINELSDEDKIKLDTTLGKEYFTWWTLVSKLSDERLVELFGSYVPID